MIVVVSPHLDDAVLSCGGILALAARRRERSVVVTVFTEGADHERRRAEDREALAIVGAEPLHLRLLDAPDRLGLARTHAALVEDARWYPILAVVTMWFLFCVYMVTSDLAAVFDADTGAGFFVGLSLPWGALVAAFSMRDHRPLTARQFAWAALGASIVLVSAAIVRFTWIRPALGQALIAMDFPAVADAVDAMDWLERTLALRVLASVRER